VHFLQFLYCGVNHCDSVLNTHISEREHRI